CARPVLRMGTAQPRCTDADPDAGGTGDAGDGDPPATSRRRAGHRLRRSRLLRAAAESVCGWLGKAVAERDAIWHGPSLPRGTDYSRAGILVRARSPAGGHLDTQPGLHRLPRNRVDAGTLPLLRVPGGRFRRLP